MSSAEVSAPHGRKAAALAAFGVAVAAVFYAASPNLARFAYDAGSDPLTVVVARYVIGAPTALLLLRLQGGRLTGGRANLWWAAAMGVLFFTQSFGYLGSVAYMPVALAVMVLYLYPIIVAVLARVLDRVPIGRIRLAAFTVAFGGVALATGVDGTGVDPRGVTLALVAAAAIALSMVPGDRFARRVGGVAFTTYSFSAAAVVASLWMLLTGQPALPGTLLGWVGLVGSALSFVAAIAILYSTMRYIDTVRISLIANLEPLFTAVLALLLHGEILTPLQVLGGALVVGAVTLSNLPAARRT